MTIGNVRPKGICGWDHHHGATLFETGIIDSRGT
jgi:hypothetical protein